MSPTHESTTPRSGDIHPRQQYSLFMIILLVATLVLPAAVSSPVTIAQQSGTNTIVVNSTRDQTTPNITDGACTLREAMQNAISQSRLSTDCTAGASVTTIDLSILIGATINLQSTLPEVNGTNRDIILDGPGMDRLTISGQNSHRIFNLNSAATHITINNLTLANGNGGGQDGGAIRSDSELSLFKVRLLNNTTAASGGAIAHNAFPFFINGSIFENNSAPNVHGGAIFVGGPAELFIENNSSFLNNTANGGGAIWIDGLPSQTRAVIANTTFSQNQANAGGGAIFNSRGALEINDSLLQLNNGDADANTSGDGGAIYNSGQVTMTQTYIRGNTAHRGGGIYQQDSGQPPPTTLAIARSTLAANTAELNGGAIATDADVTIINSTLDNNSTTGTQVTAGGGALWGPSAANFNVSISHNTITAHSSVEDTRSVIVMGSLSSIDLTHNIFALNAGTFDIVDTSVSSNGYNITDQAQRPGFFDTTDIHSATLNLGALSGNGGPTPTRLPGAGSAAIDAGDLNISSPPSFDQRGSGFPRSVGTIDIGAVEVQSLGRAPVFASAPSRTAVLGVPYTYNIVINDPDGNAVNNGITISEGGSLPAWLSVQDNGNGTAVLSGTPTTGDVGSNVVSISATDNSGLSTVQEFTIRVSGINCSGVTAVSAAQCGALADLFSSASGDDWDNSGGWFSDTAICSWAGVTCVGANITELDLRNNNLDGTLPTSLGNLTSLTALLLSNNNNLAGNLPTELANLINLQTLSFAETGLCEPIDEQFQLWLDDVATADKAAPCTQSVDYGLGVSSSTAVPGATLIFRITLRTAGEASTVSMTNTLPTGLTFVRFVSNTVVSQGTPPAPVYDPTTRTVSFQGTVEPNNPVIIRYEATVNNNFNTGGVISNSFIVQGNNVTLEDEFIVVVPEETTNDTLVLMYYVADNDLATDGIATLNSAEQAADNENATVLMMLDGPAEDDAFIYHVEHDPLLELCPNYANPTCDGRYVLGENLFEWPDGGADPGVLSEYIRSSILAYPNANQVIVSLIGHGSGISAQGLSDQRGSRRGRFDPLSGLLKDDNPEGTSVSTAGLGQALREALQGAQAAGSTRTKIDGLYLDACLMGMLEVAYEISDSVDYFLTSPHLKWAVSEYDLHINSIDGMRNTRQILEEWLKNEAGVLTAETGYPHSYVLMDLTQITPVRLALNALATDLSTALEADRDEVDAAFVGSDFYDSDGNGALDQAQDTYIDLGSFAHSLTSAFTSTTTLQALSGSAQELATAIDNLVVEEVHQDGIPLAYPGETWSWDNPSGVSIYLPLSQDEWQRSYYSDRHFQFAQDTLWDEFIDNYWGNEPPPPPVCPPDCGVPTTRLNLEQQGPGIIYLPFVAR